ncbi:MAG: helix-turn-helix domain-containing protein [Flavobacteriaceae bacterium]
MKIDAIIQKDANRYEIVIDPDKNYNLTFSLFGEGTTVTEAIEDFYISQSEIKELYHDQGKTFPENLEFNFKYDLPSFLEYYSKILTLAGLERLTGVAQGQLSHYLNGHRKPSKRTVEKIERHLHSFGEELNQVQFI